MTLVALAQDVDVLRREVAELRAQVDSLREISQQGLP